ATMAVVCTLLNARRRTSPSPRTRGEGMTAHAWKRTNVCEPAQKCWTVIFGRSGRRAGEIGAESYLQLVRDRLGDASLRIFAGAHVRVDRLVALESSAGMRRALEDDRFVLDVDELVACVDVVDLAVGLA